MSAIPTSNSVSESIVIDAPIAFVWHLIKLPTFAEFWTTLAKAEEVKGASPETDLVRWTFKDGTVLDVKQEAHSSLEHFITYSIISASPALAYSSQISTVRCWAVTSGPHENATFVQWSASFSSDADAAVIEDARFKRKEALADLAKAAAKGAPKKK